MPKFKRLVREGARRSALVAFGVSSARQHPTYRSLVAPQRFDLEPPYFAQEEYKWPKRLITTPIEDGRFELASIGVAELDRATLTSDGRVFDRRGRLVRDSLATHDYQAIHPGPFRREIDLEIDGSVLALNWFSGVDNVYHWLRDVLPRAMVIREYPKPVTIVVPHRSLGFHEAAVDGLRSFVDVQDVVTLQPAQRLRAETLVQPCMPPYIRGCGALHRESASFVRSLNGVTADTGSQAEIPCVLVARANTSHRRLEGEERLSEELKRRVGCMVFEPQSMSWADQVSIASRARVVVGVFGAGLSHLLFGRGSGCVEIHNSDSIETHFSSMCQSLGLPHRRVEGGAAGPNEDFRLAEDGIEQVYSFVEELLSARH